ncbi:hypothetical protein [Pseudonocardia parietis]|uniref:Pyridoxamine 5'-phosphate oxidase-like protein n=1 Tax=Pseudonocardia parietis TaxID=570936 RepID=A0ABS4W249_9PSEU|nr:hypothetical protein [Pseudonocardia parietis]MBP2370275.1 hypothetical protein [Pseudonocardia parietis]
MTTTHAHPLDRIADLRDSRKPVPYGLTPAAHRALDSFGPFCPVWVTTAYAGKPFRRPCLLPEHHTGGHDPRGGRSH